MIDVHDDSSGTLLPDGTTLVNGAGAAEIYDPVTGAFSNSMPTCEGQGHGAALLSDGAVLLTGGFRCCGAVVINAEIYRPAVLQSPPVLLSASHDGVLNAAILHASTHVIVSPDDPAVSGEYLEIYLAGLIGGAVIPPQAALGGRMAPVTFFGDAPGVAGLNQVNVRVPDGIAPATTVPVRLNYLNRPSNEVRIAVR